MSLSVTAHWRHWRAGPRARATSASPLWGAAARQFCSGASVLPPTCTAHEDILTQSTNAFCSEDVPHMLALGAGVTVRVVGGRVAVVFDGEMPHAWQLRMLAGRVAAVHVNLMPPGRRDLAWLSPLGSSVRLLDVMDQCDDISGLEEFADLESLSLRFRPRTGHEALRRLSELRSYEGPWFEALSPVLRSPRLTELELHQPPRDLEVHVRAPLRRLRLLGAGRLSSLAVMPCHASLEYLEVAGGKEFDLSRVGGYSVLEEVVVYGRTPLTGVRALRHCKALRSVVFEDCYSIDDASVFQHLELERLAVIGRAESMDPQLLDRLRSLKVKKLIVPPAPEDSGGA